MEFRSFVVSKIMQMLQKFDERFQTDVCSIVISKVDPKYFTEKSGPRLQKGLESLLLVNVTTSRPAQIFQSKLKCLHVAMT